MNNLALELTKIIGKRDKTINDISGVTNEPATLSDFHRWMNEKGIKFLQYPKEILFDTDEDDGCLVYEEEIKYDSSKGFLDQSNETLSQILELIKTNS